jgi:hypothetical protein
MVDRNKKFSCGSGLKYKKCCLAKEIEQANDILLNPPIRTVDQILKENIQREESIKKGRNALALMAEMLASCNSSKIYGDLI